MKAYFNRIANLADPRRRACRSCVKIFKGLMERAQVALISLLSALSLLVSGQNLCIPVPCDCDVQALTDAACTLNYDGPSCSHGAHTSDISSSQAFSRTGKQFGKSNLTRPCLLRRSSPLDENSLNAPSPQGELPLAFASSWQFKWRAALEPRAPCSGS